MKNKKIVVLSAFYEPYMSGAEQMVKEVLERLGDEYDMTLVTARFDKKLPEIEERPNFKLIRVGIGHKKIDKILYPLLSALKVRALKPETTHAIMESYAGGALVLVKYLYKKTFRILTLQSGDLDDNRKQSKPWIRFFWKKIHTSPDKITAISSFLAKRAERLGVAKEKISVIPNGVDLSQIPKNIKKEKQRVLFVGRLSWEKGINFLLEAWPGVKEKNKEAELVIVGGGAEEENLKKQAENSGIKDIVKFSGPKNHSEVLAEMSKSEIFICPSLAEGLGIVFIEAQACGAVPIGTKVGGIPDVIQDGENGLLVESKNPADIEKALNRLLSDRELLQKLSQKARETVKKYNWNNIMNDIRGEYEKAEK